MPRPWSHVVGIDIGSQTCRVCALKPDKSRVLKPINFANAAPGFAVWLEKGERLAVSPQQILIGLEATSRSNEIHAMLSVLFPELSPVFPDPCRATALALLKLYPSAQAMLTAGVEILAAKFHELAPPNYGRSTAEQ